MADFLGDSQGGLASSASPASLGRWMVDAPERGGGKSCETVAGAERAFSIGFRREFSGGRGYPHPNAMN